MWVNPKYFDFDSSAGFYSTNELLNHADKIPVAQKIQLIYVHTYDYDWLHTADEKPYVLMAVNGDGSADTTYINHTYVSNNNVVTSVHTVQR